MFGFLGRIWPSDEYRIEQCVVGVRCSSDTGALWGRRSRNRKNFESLAGRWIGMQDGYRASNNVNALTQLFEPCKR
ncbi:MAG: hypothetical protein DWI26_03660 [Planctomycetota bacterium]|nr:MAG: hypothetical protein DWH99_04445 [Planctomycetota bacterium]RLT16714.1 MAG: hypothetical protein DWI26_03660 [Planctomycetota bacterium]